MPPKKTRKSPRKSVKKSPKKSVKKSPKKSPRKSPRKSHRKSPKKSIKKSRVYRINGQPVSLTEFMRQNPNPRYARPASSARAASPPIRRKGCHPSHTARGYLPCPDNSKQKDYCLPAEVVSRGYCGMTNDLIKLQGEWRSKDFRHRKVDL